MKETGQSVSITILFIVFLNGTEAVFLDLAMGGMNPKRESKRHQFMFTYFYMFVQYTYNMS